MKTIYKIFFSISFLLVNVTIAQAQTPTWTYNGDSGIYINPLANVGIGTTAPYGRMHITCTSGNIGLVLDLKENSTNTYSPMIIWDSRKGGASYFFTARQAGNFLTFGRGTNYGGSNWAGEKDLMTMNANGNIGIGVANPGTKLDVAGTIRAHEVKVCLNQGCDFVFEEDYDLMSISDLSTFIKTNKHLPEVAPAAIMESEGINVSEMNALLLQKIEELTLYMIQQQEEINMLKSKIK